MKTRNGLKIEIEKKQKESIIAGSPPRAKRSKSYKQRREKDKKLAQQKKRLGLIFNIKRFLGLMI